MALKKPDGIIEAVRVEDGKITAVRAFERRGPTFGDRVLLDREGLLERLRKGKKFMTGRRKEFWASTFETGGLVHAVGPEGSEWISTRADATRDGLEGVPFF